METPLLCLIDYLQDWTAELFMDMSCLPFECCAMTLTLHASCTAFGTRRKALVLSSSKEASKSSADRCSRISSSARYLQIDCRIVVSNWGAGYRSCMHASQDSCFMVIKMDSKTMALPVQWLITGSFKARSIDPILRVKIFSIECSQVSHLERLHRSTLLAEAEGLG